MEHIPRSLSPTGEIESAPKEFSLYVSVRGPSVEALVGLVLCMVGRGGGDRLDVWWMQVGETEEEERHFLGNYTYLGEKPRETIAVQVGGV